MATGIVTVVSGVMNPLIGKLTTLMGDEYKKFKGVRKQASFLEKELSAMNAALHNLELMDVELDPAIKDWRDHVREMSYDMENCIDDFMRQSRVDDAKAGFIKKTARRIKKLRERLRIAHRIEELKTLALEANDRRQRYNIDDWKPTSSIVAVDPRLRAVYQEADTLVGIDGPREEVATWLMDPHKRLKVVSIVGFGGLGKTTLAKQVYEKIGSHFGCKAFFSVSQRPDMTELLNNFQLKLGMKDPDLSRARKVDDIIEELRKHLRGKSMAICMVYPSLICVQYLIVVDDVWDISAWNIIKCAFPEDGNGSRVIVTTRVEGVARGACENHHEGIYRLKPLSEQNSKKLLLNRVSGSQHGSRPQLQEVMAEILKKCHGLPLAIITIGSLLATEDISRKGWESIKDSLGVQSATDPTLEEMKSILNLSYLHLPVRLRTCFLYLGMYVENSEIFRDDLIRQWIAEGLLVSNLHLPDLEDVGKSYFNELLNKNMIQPCKTEYGEVLSCRVHDLMLDLILSKCDVDNFMSVAYSYEDMARLHENKYKVRRLSLRSMAGGGATYRPAIDVILSQVRSFILFGNTVPSLLLFKYLRVLKIGQDWTAEHTLDLTAIGELFQLSYLYISKEHGFVQLPAKLKGLAYLETLYIGSAQLKSIPSDISHLYRLSSLEIGLQEVLPEWIGNMKSLHSLIIWNWDGVMANQSKVNAIKGIIGLGELTNLRRLKIQFGFLEKPEIDALSRSIGKLHNLKYIDLSGNYIDGNIQLGSLSNPFEHIEQFLAISWALPSVPIWMGGLHCLRILELRVEEMSTEEFHLLGELPSLVKLVFRPSHIPKERAIVGMGLFPVLECFNFSSNQDVVGYLGFEAGAMPNLRELDLFIMEWSGSLPVGMWHLSHLQKVGLYAAHTGDPIVSAFQYALSVHPNRPSVYWAPKIHCVKMPGLV